MAEHRAADYQRAIAERNVGAILDAAEELLEERAAASISAVAEQLTPQAVTRTHQAVHRTVGALLERGQADGSFRTDLPAAWLVTACIALIHACAQEVRAGRIRERDAARILTATVRDLFTGARRA